MSDTGGNLPTFVNIGPGRCGTSWLWEMLLAHPEVAMSRVKETEYFNANTDKDIAWYRAFFPMPGKAVGEISNMYYVEPDIGARLQAFDPDLKVIINLRRPEDLLLSYAQFAVRRGLVDAPIHAVDLPVGRVMGSGFNQKEASGTLTAGDQTGLVESVLLDRYVASVLRSFPSDQVFFLIYDRIEAEPEALLADLFAFLGVDPTFQPESLHDKINASAVPRSRILARMASGGANVLRRTGAYGLLRALHRSTLVKKILLRGSPKADEIVQHWSLPATVRADLDTATTTLLEKVPTLRSYWSVE